MTDVDTWKLNCPETVVLTREGADWIYLLLKANQIRGAVLENVERMLQIDS